MISEVARSGSLAESNVPELILDAARLSILAAATVPEVILAPDKLSILAAATVPDAILDPDKFQKSARQRIKNFFLRNKAYFIVEKFEQQKGEEVETIQ